MSLAQALLATKQSTVPEIEIHLFEDCNLACSFCCQEHNSGVDFNFDKKLELIKNFIDKKSFAIGLATSLMFGEEHSLSKANARYYINPYTSLIHFIPADHGYATHQNTDLQKISVFLNSLPKFIIYLISKIKNA